MYSYGTGRQPKERESQETCPQHRETLRTKGGSMKVFFFLIPILLSGEEIYWLKEIVVTATRYPIALKDLAIATTVIDKETIMAQNPACMGDILSNHAGIDIRDYGVSGQVSSISLRGIPASGVLVLIDGQPINSVQTGIADLSTIDANSIERIEIVKGPVSSLYGANGLGGAINIVTSGLLEKPDLGIQTTFSSANLENPLQNDNLFFHAGMPIRNAHFRIDGSSTNGTGSRSNSEFSGYSIKGAGMIAKIRMALSYDQKDYGVPGPKPLVDSLHTVPAFGDSTASSLFDHEKDRQTLGSIDFNWPITDRLGITSKFFAQYNTVHYHTFYSAWSGDTIADDYYYKTYTTGLYNFLHAEIGSWNNVLGIDIRYDTLSTTQLSTMYPDTLWNVAGYNLGAWFDMKRRFSHIMFNPSLRYDRNSSFGSFFSPQLGLVLDVSSKTSIKYSMGRAFRAPGFNDLYWPVNGNPNLKPEYGTAYELRIEMAPVPWSLFAGSVFTRGLDDKITWVPGQNGLWKPENVNHVSIKGFEAEVQAKFLANYRITLDYTYLRAKQRNRELVYYDYLTSEMKFEEIERDAAFIPEHNALVSFDITFPGHLMLSITNSYTSARTNFYENWTGVPEISMQTKTIKGHYLCNICLNSYLFGLLKLGLGSRNLFDTDYAVQFGNSADDLNYPMPGRTVYVQIALNL